MKCKKNTRRRGPNLCAEQRNPCVTSSEGCHTFIIAHLATERNNNFPAALPEDEAVKLLKRGWG